jgi:hypothetical protein
VVLPEWEDYQAPTANAHESTDSGLAPVGATELWSSRCSGWVRAGACSRNRATSGGPLTRRVGYGESLSSSRRSVYVTVITGGRRVAGHRLSKTCR